MSYDAWILIGLVAFVTGLLIWRVTKLSRPKEKPDARRPVQKVEKQPEETSSECTISWAARAMNLVWLIITLALITLVVFLGVWVKNKVSDNKPTSAKTNVIVQETWYGHWETESGDSFNAQTKGSPQLAEIVRRTDTEIWVNLYFNEYRSKEATYFRATRGSPTSGWSGTWTQDNPKRGGKIKRVKMNDGEIEMIITDKKDQRFIYVFERAD